MKTNILLKHIGITLALIAGAGVPASAQVPVQDDGTPIEALGPLHPDEAQIGEESAAALPPAADTIAIAETELAELVGPVALYPDDLLAIVLPASTFPLQIVQAARFLDAVEQDSSLQPDESWDESIVALLNYPDVVRMLNDDIDWTWQLGEAVIAQQADVLQAVEHFRDRAYVAGNLKTDEHQTITMDEGIIEIVPIEDDVIYVPYYDPEIVVVEQPRREYYYYPDPYPVYYYPYPRSHSFASGYFWGVTTAYNIGWDSHHLRVHHPSYWGHPYYGRHYYDHYYRRPSITVYNTTYVNNPRYHDRHRRGDYWTPRRGSGARQSDYTQHTRSYNNTANRVAYTGDRSANRRVSNQGQPVNDTRVRARESVAQITRRDARDVVQSRGTERRRSPVASSNREQRQSSTQNRTRRTASNQQPRNTTPAQAERRATPVKAKQERRATPVKQERRVATARQERRAAPAVATQERRAAPVRTERRATAQRQERRSASRPERASTQVRTERKAAPARQQQKQKTGKTCAG